MNVSIAEVVARESRRASERREVMIPCQAVRLEDFVLVADRTLDMSVDGLLLPMHESVAISDALIVSFQILGMWIDLEATVARVVHNRRPGDDGLAMGIVFDDVKPSVRAAIAGFLHGRRAPLPRRGPLARMRRGQAIPRLADEAMMARRDLHDLVDIIDIADESDVIEDNEVDGLEVLRAVARAWEELANAKSPK